MGQRHCSSRDVRGMLARRRRLGSGRMAYLGPNALFTALATFVLTYVGGLACDQLRRLRNWWSSRRALRSVDLREQSNDILDVGRHIGMTR